MQPLVDRAQLEQTLSSLLRRVQPDARVDVTERGFLGDILEARIEVGTSDEPRGYPMIKETAPKSYHRAGAQPVNLLVSAEAARDMLANPKDYFGSLERIVLAASHEPDLVAYWVLTTSGLQQVRVGSGIVGMSEEFVDDLADRMAIEEGTKEFTTWLSRASRDPDIR